MDSHDEVQRILILDDSLTVLESVRHVLESADYETLAAQSGEAALKLLNKHGLPHLAIVDINLGPGRMNGFDFCERLQQFSDVPVILLTSYDDEQSIVTGLQHYAEDYIIKPFRSAELKVRVWRVLHRIGDYSYTLDPVINVDSCLQINLPQRQIIINGNEQQLTPTETKILYILLKNAGRTVRTEFLLRRIWPLEQAFEDRLHPHIYRLRKKIEVNARDPHYIIADWGVGYHFPARLSRQN